MPFGARGWLLALVQARQGEMPHSAQMRSASKTTHNAAGNPSRGRPGARRTSAPATNDYKTVTCFSQLIGLVK